MAPRERIPRNLVATPLLKLAQDIHNFIFQNCKCPFEIEITDSFQVLLKIHPLLQRKYIPFYFNTFGVSLLLGFGSCLYLLLLAFYYTNVKLGTLNVVILITLLICALVEFGAYFIIVIKGDLPVAAVNGIYKLERTGFKIPQKRGWKDTVGIVIMLVNFIAFYTIPVAPFIALFWDIDPFYKVINFAGPEPYYVDRCTAISFCFVRAFLCFICAYEFFRACSLGLFLGVGTTITVQGCLRALSRCRRKSLESIVLQRYRELIIVSKWGEYPSKYGVLVTMTGIQWLSVVTIWVCLKGWGFVPSVGIFGISTLVVLEIYIVLAVLPNVSSITEESKDFVKKKQNEWFTFNRTSQKYYYTKCWKAQNLLPAKFGNCFYVDQNTPMSYMESIAESVTDAVLLIHPS